MEVIASLNPDWILSPSSLQSDLQPKYEAIHTDWAFLKFKKCAGKCISQFRNWEKFSEKKKKPRSLRKNLRIFMKNINRKSGKRSPKVLILMGLRDLISLQRKTLMWEVLWRWQAEKMYMPEQIRNF